MQERIPCGQLNARRCSYVGQTSPISLIIPNRQSKSPVGPIGFGASCGTAKLPPAAVPRSRPAPYDYYDDGPRYDAAYLESFAEWFSKLLAEALATRESVLRP
jgi:hypothetical protein